MEVELTKQEKAKKYAKEYRQKNREKILEGQRDWRSRNKDYYTAYHKKKYKDNPERLRNIKLKGAYGITLDDFNEMLNKQNHLCAICGNSETAWGSRKGKVKTLCVDHNHNSGKIRGLLCSWCNTGLGQFKENTETLERAINYINKWNKEI